MQTLLAFLRRVRITRFKLSSSAAIQGYGDVNIDSSSPGRHTPGY